MKTYILKRKQRTIFNVHLAVALARMYPDYQCKIIPIVWGATGLITESLVDNMKELRFSDAKYKRNHNENATKGVNWFDAGHEVSYRYDVMSVLVHRPRNLILCSYFVIRSS